MPDPIIAISPTVTVDTTANAAGANIGGKLTLSDVVHPDRPYGMIRQVRLVSEVISTIGFDVFFFHADPSGSSFATHMAQSIVTADQAKVSAVVALSENFADGECSVHQASELAIPFVASADGKLYATIVARGAITFLAANNVSLRVLLQQAG